MIISIRGNNASGKSYAVRQVLNKIEHTAVFGMLGAKYPEGYRLKTKVPTFVLGPYLIGHGGIDVVTKKGLPAVLKLFDKYRSQGNVLFEGILTSIRFQEPTIGAWLVEHKRDVAVLTFDTPAEICLKYLRARQAVHNVGGDKHFAYNQVMLDRVTKKLDSLGFKQELVNRETVVPRILSLLGVRK